MGNGTIYRRGNSWCVGFTMNGRRVRETVGPNKKVAEKVLSMIVGRMNEVIYTRCCIAGGGPAGVMLGFLLARMGIDVFVLEKHADFLRDFRGDTIHPST